MIQRYGTGSSRSTTGKPYVTLVHGGVKPEGEVMPPALPSAQEAWAAYFEKLNAYLGAAAVVEWRMPPQLEGDEATGYRVYSRLSVEEGLD